MRYYYLFVILLFCNLSYAKKKTVTVVGAGIAGLTAANLLKRNGFDVLVLEAQSVTGGRIHSVKLNEHIIDMGAAILLGAEENPLTQLVLEAGLETRIIDNTNASLFDHNNQIMSSNNAAYAITTGTLVFDAAGEYARNLSTDISVLQGLKVVLNKTKISKQDLQYVQYVADGISEVLGFDLDLLSLKSYDQRKWYEGNDYVFPKGFQQITDFLIEQADLHILLNHAVRSIKFALHEQQVHVETQNNQKFISDYVVVAVPAAILNDIEFTSFELAIKRQNVEMGYVEKIALEFDLEALRKIQFPDYVGYLNESLNKKKGFCGFYSLVNADIPVIFAVFGSQHMKQRQKMTDQTLVHMALRELAKLYPSLTYAALKGWVVTRFSENRFFRGSFINLLVNQTEDTLIELCKPIAHRIFFTGEHCSTKRYATTDGAYSHALTVAQSIISL